jgi:nucleotide-binding universal stress UspA family protein
MSYKSILVHVTAGPQTGRAVEAAVDLAGRFDAYLLGVGAEMYDIGIMAASPYLDGEGLQALRGLTESNLETARKRFAELTASLPKSEWVSELDYPGTATPYYCRRADLAVVCRPDPGASSLSALQPADLVMQAGLPVLLTPSTPARLEAKRVVVGWKDTREARRAVTDALPFLTAAETVFVLGVGGGGEADTDREALAQVAERLRRHGAHAVTDVVQRGQDSVAQALDRFADANGADLLVMGAYGHSRVREWAFGGVTQELMDASNRYVLLSH